MKKIKNKQIILGVILLSIFIFTGCQNIFLPLNVPMVIEENPKLKEVSEKNIEIQSYDEISPGIVQDISHTGKSLLLLNSNISEDSYTIDLFNTETSEIIPFINSDKKELSSQFDSNDSGVFYVEESLDPVTKKLGRQLLWTDIDKNITRIISLPEENVSKLFSIGDPEKVIYTNNRNEIIISDNQGNRDVYFTNKNYNITDIAYFKPKNSIIFLSEDPLKEGKKNLYHTEIQKDSPELDSKLIEESVIDFDVNELNKKIVFIKNSGDKQNIDTWDFSAITSPTTLASGNFNTVQFSPSGDNILYTQGASNSELKTQSIWIMNADGKDPLQITSTLKLTSPVISHPFKSTLYFSVEEEYTKENILKGSSPSRTYQINYNIF